MKKPKSIFLIVYFIFHVLLLVVAIYVNFRSEDFEFLLYLRNKMSLIIYVTAFGLILYFVNLLFVGLENSAHVKEKAVLEQEINALKAKMFDLQEATGKAETKTVIPEKETASEDEKEEGSEE